MEFVGPSHGRRARPFFFYFVVIWYIIYRTLQNGIH